MVHGQSNNNRERSSLFASNAMDLLQELIEWPTPKQWMDMPNN